MKVDWDELNRLQGSDDPNNWMLFARILDKAWPSILAERSAAENLYDKTATLYDYLLETDEEGLIHHATQMRDISRTFKPEMTDEEFDVLWAEFVRLKTLKSTN